MFIRSNKTLRQHYSSSLLPKSPSGIEGNKLLTAFYYSAAVQCSRSTSLWVFPSLAHLPRVRCIFYRLFSLRAESLPLFSLFFLERFSGFSRIIGSRCTALLAALNKTSNINEARRIKFRFCELRINARIHTWILHLIQLINGRRV